MEAISDLLGLGCAHSGGRDANVGVITAEDLDGGMRLEPRVNRRSVCDRPNRQYHHGSQPRRPQVRRRESGARACQSWW